MPAMIFVNFKRMFIYTNSMLSLFYRKKLINLKKTYVFPGVAFKILATPILVVLSDFWKKLKIIFNNQSPLFEDNKNVTL